MAGLGIDDALPKLIPAKTHAIIDYIHAGTNFVAAALFATETGGRPTQLSH